MSRPTSSSISEKPSALPPELTDGPEYPHLNGAATLPKSSPALALAKTSITELLVACIYPATLVLATLFRALSSDPASTSSYFSQKNNLFNVLFVKYGWFWTTVAFALHVMRLRHSSRSKAAIRYTLATVWWILVTQWCFGAPIMDRTFTVTGGKCQLIQNDPAAAAEEMGVKRMFATSAACKVAGGTWAGGHDLSGHVFMLTHASLFLWSEVLPTLTLPGQAWWGVENGAVFATIGLWWWMLMMTGIYFHTWREKLTGWLVALVEWGVVYLWALKTQATARETIGVPGA